eukprot:1000823_1
MISELVSSRDNKVCIEYFRYRSIEPNMYASSATFPTILFCTMRFPDDKKICHKLIIYKIRYAILLPHTNTCEFVINPIYNAQTNRQCRVRLPQSNVGSMYEINEINE